MGSRGSGGAPAGAVVLTRGLYRTVSGIASSYAAFALERRLVRVKCDRGGLPSCQSASSLRTRWKSEAFSYLLQQAGDFLLKAVQKEQTREFNRRLYENKKSSNQTEAVKQLEEQQRRNAKAEKLLDENLKTLGVDITNVGDLNEKLTFLPMTVEQLQLLKAITASTLHEIRTENKTVSLAKTEAAVFSSMSCS